MWHEVQLMMGIQWLNHNDLSLSLNYCAGIHKCEEGLRLLGKRIPEAKCHQHWNWDIFEDDGKK